MAAVMAMSCGVLPAVGALMALCERDISPALAIARGGSALAVGLYACGWSADALEGLAHAIERNRLALLAQLLGALHTEACALPLRKLALLALGELPMCECEPTPAAPGDPVEAVLHELTRGALLRDAALPLALPVRAHLPVRDRFLPQPEPRLLTSRLTSCEGAWRDMPLSVALRCAAFAPGLLSAPKVGSALLTAWPDERGESCAWHKLGHGAPLVSICPERAAARMRANTPARLVIPIPEHGLHESPRARIAAGYAAVKAHMRVLLCFC